MEELTRQKINRCIAEISDGDYSALEILSSLVSARMLSVAQSVLHQRSLAEDAVQDAFVKIVDNAKRFDKKTNGYAWICKITQNCVQPTSITMFPPLVAMITQAVLPLIALSTV